MNHEGLEGIEERFRIFASYCEDSSKLYHCLALRIAEDKEILSIAAMGRKGQPEPNLLFGAIHLLLINGKDHGLRRFYPSLVHNFESADNAYLSFRQFALEFSDEIIQLLQEKLVQTNEVQRSSYLYPAILTAYRFFEDRPIALIELGASAGFNLLWDQYLYQYDEDKPIGLSGSSLTISCSFRGEKRPIMNHGLPTISSRTGIDLNPIDVMNQDQISWLEALIWPEHFDRKLRLRKALRIALENPVKLFQGDAIAELPQVLLNTPASEVPFVFHTWVANQMSDKQRQELLEIVDNFGRTRDVVHIHTNIEPHLHATIYRNGERIDLSLAYTDGHARWIEWLA